MLITRHVDELAANADASARLAQAALDDVAHAQLTGDLFRADILPLVREAGIAGDDGEPARSRQLRDQILGKTVEECLCFAIIA